MRNEWQERLSLEGNREKGNTRRIREITGLGVLTAIVILLQLFGTGIRFGPFAVSLVNVPLCVGAILYGVTGGLWLGFVFGMVVLLSGDAGLFLVVSISGTILTVLVKGMAAGAGAGAAYKLLSAKNRVLASAVSAMICPIINTGIFLIGCMIFFMDTMRSWAAAAGMENVAVYMLVGLVGTNFLAELVVSAVLTPVLIRLIGMIRKTS